MRDGSGKQSSNGRARCADGLDESLSAVDLFLGPVVVNGICFESCVPGSDGVAELSRANADCKQ